MIVGSCQFLRNSRLWRLTLGSLDVKNMIKVPEYGQEDGQGQVCAKAILSLWGRGGVHEVEQA